jgi:polysaccharide pyruvyl transferase WcaK-like protein
MKITYEGFYGFKNAGDDAFVEVSSWGAQKFWSCSKNVFIGAQLPKTSNSIVVKEFKVKGLDRVSFFQQLQNSDYMISAGGSTFSKLPFHSNKALGHVLSKYNKKLKLGAIGVSVGPFKSVSDEQQVQKYLKQLTFISLRDQRSYDYVSSLDLPGKVVNSFDLAALMPMMYNHTPQNITSQSSAKTIGISICNYEQYTGGDLLKQTKRNSYFKELVRLLIKQTNYNLKVFIINGNESFGDTKATNKLLAGVDPKRYSIYPYTPNIKSTWDEISRCDFMISTRLHASIFACYANVPFVLIEYHRKCSDFLDDVGQHQALRVMDGETSPGQTLQEVIRHLEMPYTAPKRITETIDRALLNFTQTLEN